MGCSVYQYFGERHTSSGLKVFKTAPDNINYPDFDCSILKESLELDFDTFRLTELEMLSSASLDTWLSYCAKKDHDGGGSDLLGTKIFKFLNGQGFDDYRQVVVDMFTGLLNNNYDNTSEGLVKTQTSDIWAKLEVARQWLSQIHSSFYGQQYLIEVGDSSVGACIKDRFGNAPSDNVKVESEGGIYYSSDAPSTSGGWLSKNQTSVMGLSVGTKELAAFTENDNRISCFVKFKKSTSISKFNLTWDVDLSKLGDSNFYQKEDMLYVKADINPALYQIDSKQYVLVTLNNSASLRLSKDSVTDCPRLAATMGAVALMTLHGTVYQSSLEDSACDDKQNTNSGTVVNLSQVNVFQLGAPAICPEEFCIPLKSNVFVYGPWFYQANPIGGTEVEANRELAPWNFSNLQNNGYETMNYYGDLIASDGPRGLQKQENGSITVAALPSYSIGYVVGGNAATLTDIQINIGDNGYTTTYNFQTYAPKFGKPGRHLADLWSRNYKSLSYMQKFFKEENLKIRELINQTATIRQEDKYRDKSKPITSGDVIVEPPDVAGSNSSKTPHMMLYSGYRMRLKDTTDDGGSDTMDNGTSIISPCSCKSSPSIPPPVTSSTASPGNNIKNMPIAVTETSLHNTWYRENHFNRLAISTLDLIFCPISTNQEGDENGELPRLSMYQDYSGSHIEFKDKEQTALGDGKAPNSRTRSEIPPFYFEDILQYDLPIHQMYLNSVTSTVMLSDWLSRINGSTDGFVTNIIGYGSEAKNFTLSGLEDAENKKQDETNFRYSVLRGPLSLQAWGYDTAGKPVPNSVDSARQAEKGRFRRRGLQDKFLKNWLSNPKTWPAGPIDLRWDRERGVWVSPPANKIVVARLLGNLERFGTAEAELIDPQAGGVKFYEEYDVWSGEGANIKGSLSKTKIKVYDFLGIRLCKCDYIYAYYDDNRYIVLESNRAYKDPNELCCATTTTAQTTKASTQPTPTQATPTSCWCNLECLKTLNNFKEGKHQALVHKQETSGPDCLVWEDIVECYTTPPNYYDNNP